ncbi:MAG: FG-GAP repeat protein [Thermoanaerobaculia bacterium]
MNPRPLLSASTVVTTCTLAGLLGGAALAQPDVGVSSVRAQRFLDETFGAFTAASGDDFAATLAVGDFNGDGADDLATGILFDSGIPGIGPLRAGAVEIRYGSLAPGHRGLHGGIADLFLRESSTFDAPEVDDGFGESLAACDFNGDGRDDLAVGVPGEDLVSALNTGAVEIRYGSAAGLAQDAAAFYTEDTAGIPSEPATNDQFGVALACGDWNGDGFADLAIGAPGENVAAGVQAAGMVIVINGSAAGLNPATSTSFHQNTANVPDSAETSDAFGLALASGNFDGGFEDLVVASPGESNGPVAQTGAIHMFAGSPTGLLMAGSIELFEASANGASEENDRFGTTLATGDFDGDGFDDLAIGVPREDGGPGGTIDSSGQTVVFFGDPIDFALARTLFLDQDSVLGTGTSETMDFFGNALAVGDFDGDGFDDLAIGQPGEFVLSPRDGAVTVVMGSASGLAIGRHRGGAAGFDGIPGNNQVGFRFFGGALAAGDFDGDGVADLAIGAPTEDFAGLDSAGTETILYGALFADGFESVGGQYWSGVVP